MITPRLRAPMLLLAVALSTGCVESNFDLADESPLPRWFALSPGLRRGDVSMRLDILIASRYEFVLLRKRDGSRVTSVVAEVQDRAEVTVPQLAAHGFPVESGAFSYQRIRVDGVEEVIGFYNQQLPVIGVVRDPAILNGIDKWFNEVGPSSSKR